MRPEDWFKSPLRVSNSNVQDIHFGNIEQPSPKYLIKLQHDLFQGENSNGKISFTSFFKPVQNQVSIPQYLIPYNIQISSRQEAVKSQLIKLQQSIELTLSPECSSKQRNRKYKIRTLAQKQLILAQAYQNGLNRTCKKYNVSVNNICRWRKRCERKIGAGRKISDPEMQQELIHWIQLQPGLIEKKEVREKAKELCKNQNFKGSKGWFQRLIIRHPQLKDSIQL